MAAKTTLALDGAGLVTDVQASIIHPTTNTITTPGHPSR